MWICNWSLDFIFDIFDCICHFLLVLIKLYFDVNQMVQSWFCRHQYVAWCNINLLQNFTSKFINFCSLLLALWSYPWICIYLLMIIWSWQLVLWLLYHRIIGLKLWSIDILLIWRFINVQIMNAKLSLINKLLRWLRHMNIRFTRIPINSTCINRLHNWRITRYDTRQKSV